jgi:hypothetical protein
VSDRFQNVRQRQRCTIVHHYRTRTASRKTRSRILW